MPIKTSRVPLSPHTVDEASKWFVEFRLSDADARTREQFNAWLRASPTHVHAYLEIARTYAGLAPPGIDIKLDVDRLIAEARADRHVLELPVPAKVDGLRSRAPRTPLVPRRRWWAALAASVIVVVMSAAVWNFFYRGMYATQIGEQRSLSLEDGSRIDLNARSKVRIRFDGRERRIDLLRGQALFRVAKDMRRPFVVRAEDTRIRVLGTTFDVNRGPTRTRVTVLEGTVAIVVPDSVASSQPVTVVGGQQLTLTKSIPPRATPADIAAATAWTERRLVFEGTPLIDVVEEFNRYNERQLVITDERLNEFYVSGIYASPDPASLLTFLRTEPDILVTESREEVRIARR